MRNWAERILDGLFDREFDKPQEDRIGRSSHGLALILMDSPYCSGNYEFCLSLANGYRYKTPEEREKEQS